MKHWLAKKKSTEIIGFIFNFGGKFSINKIGGTWNFLSGKKDHNIDSMIWLELMDLLICLKDTWTYLFLDCLITLTSSFHDFLIWKNTMGSWVFLTYFLQGLFYSLILILISLFIHLASLSSTVITLFRIKLVIMFRIASLNMSTCLSTSTFSNALDQSKESITWWIEFVFAFWYCHTKLSYSGGW